MIFIISKIKNLITNPYFWFIFIIITYQKVFHNNFSDITNWNLFFSPFEEIIKNPSKLFDYLWTFVIQLSIGLIDPKDNRTLFNTVIEDIKKISKGGKNDK